MNTTIPDNYRLDMVADSDYKNTKTSIEFFPNLVHEAERLSIAYDDLGNSRKGIINRVFERHENLCISFMKLSQSELMNGIMSSFRGQRDECLLHGRRSIEFCVTFNRMLENEYTVPIWLNALQDEKSYRKFKKDFSTKAIFKGPHLSLQELYGRYSNASREIHGNVRTAMSRLRFVADPEGGFKVWNETRDFWHEGSKEPVQSLLWTCHTHIIILRTYKEMLSIICALSLEDWQKTIEVLEIDIIRQEKELLEDE